MAIDPDDYALLLDTTVTESNLAVLDLPAGCTVGDTAKALEAFFLDDTEAQAVIVTVADDIVGVSSRDRLQALGSAVVRSMGDGAGATLPGTSLHYRILRFRCRTCGATARRIHLDTRTEPVCPNGHGAMELER